MPYGLKKVTSVLVNAPRAGAAKTTRSFLLQLDFLDSETLSLRFSDPTEPMQSWEWTMVP